MRVLLSTINVSYIHQNLAIRFLYHLNKNYPGLEYHEFFMKNKLRDIADFCAQYNVVAFSCYIWNIERTLQLAEAIKQQKPQIKIMLGGPEVSYEWQNVIANSNIDYIIAGEGEIPFTQFLKHYPDVEKVPDLIWKNKNKITKNKKAEVFDLKKLAPFNPYLFDDTHEIKNKIAYIESSRGCPFSCSFCLAGLDNNLRFLPIEAVKQQLLFLMQKAKIIKFLDRTFNAKRKFAIEIFQFILDNHRPQNIFQFEIKADTLHPEIIDFVLEKVPPALFRFEVGIQTISEKANLASKRKQDFHKVKQIINQLAPKIEFHLDLIVGLPHDYWNDIKFSVDEVFRFHASEIQLGFLKFLKGTSNRNMAAEHQYVYDPKPPYQIIESKYLTKTEIEKIWIIEHILGIYWNKKRAIRTMKYLSERTSVFDFMLDFGLFAKQHIHFHKYTLNHIFDVLWRYIQQKYPTDTVLQQLVSIDFYMLHKVRPNIRFVPEITKKEKNNMIQKHGLNHHKYRFVIIPIHFDYAVFNDSGQINILNNNLIIQYCGTQFPKIIFV